MLTTQPPEVRQEYGTAKGWRLFIYIIIPPLILGLLAVPFLLWQDDDQLGLTIGVTVGAIGMALFLGYGLLETIQGRHIITADKLIYQGVLRRKELPLANIKGFRIDEHYTHIVPMSPADPKIRIGYTSEQYSAMQQWFAAHYPNLDVQEQQEAAARLLQEEDLGRTVEEREATLATASQVAKVANIAGGLVAAWLFLEPQPYQWAIAAGLALPLLATVLLWLHRGVIRPDEVKNSAYPSITVAFLMPALALVMRVLMDFELLSYAPLWPVAGTVAVLVALLLLVGSQPFIARNDSRASLLLSCIAYAAVYGFAAVISYNCTFDESQGATYDVQILDKHKSSGKTTTYYVKVSPWGRAPRLRTSPYPKTSTKAPNPAPKLRFCCSRGIVHSLVYYSRIKKPA
ncbi:hypothetical protein [Hymenobacter cellulosilyticus]|uniref:PH domain-containing protein n=1 Tax=Hymenobacter cellulosilyticus TaxID=2932248 RepID=A0A8T9Q7Y6_9BACT|nr:hypothetical protein [Hymenobacter cellulosilyticus]UOQ72531.1 hypothetical protein MUN79_00555 [Hymenobacter cellulosilyticus]